MKDYNSVNYNSKKLQQPKEENDICILAKIASSAIMISLTVKKYNKDVTIVSNTRGELNVAI